MAHFGKNLRRLRDARGLTQTDLAAAAGMSLSSIQKAELMQLPQMRPKSYRRIAEALGLDASGLDHEWGHEPIPGHPDVRFTTLRVESSVIAKFRHVMWPPTTNLEKWVGWMFEYLCENKAFAQQFSNDVFRFGAAMDRGSGAEPAVGDPSPRDPDRQRGRKPKSSGMTPAELATIVALDAITVKPAGKGGRSVKS